MGIELSSCIKCGGKGKLFDFEHTYDPKNKSIKFLNVGNGLKTHAECIACGRYTRKCATPIEAINKWNEGEIYNSEEWSDKLDREYIGKIYSECDIKDYIFQTDFENNAIEFIMTDTSNKTIYLDKTDNCYCLLFNSNLEEKSIDKFIDKFLKYIRYNKFRVAEIHQVRCIN